MVCVSLRKAEADDEDEDKDEDEDEDEDEDGDDKKKDEAKAKRRLASSSLVPCDPADAIALGTMGNHRVCRPGSGWTEGW